MLVCLLSLATAGLLAAGGCRDTLDPFDRLHPGPRGRLVVTDTLLADADTYIRQSSPNTNWGTDTALQLGGGGRSRVLVRFDSTALRAVVGAGTLDSAWLEFTITAGPQGWGTNERTVDLHRLLRDWTELGATWNCAVDANPANSVPDCPTQGWDMTNNGNGTYAPGKTDRVKVSNGQTGVLRLGVTADVAAFLGGSQLHQGWVFRKTSESQGGEAVIFSRESGSQPRLVVRVTTSVVPPVAPDSVPLAIWNALHAPSNMAPGDARLTGPFPRNLVLVEFQPSASPSQRQAAIDLVNGAVIGGIRLGSDGWYYVQITDDGTTGPLWAAVDQLSALPYVRNAMAEPHEITPNYLRPVDAVLWRDWRLVPDSADGENWALEAINAPFGWGCATGSASAKVAVVDHGFHDLPDFRVNVAASSSPMFGQYPSVTHGTQVASILGAVGNDTVGMTGVAWRTSMELREYHLGPNVHVTLGAAQQVFNAGMQGARVINLSSGKYWLATSGRLPNPTTADSQVARDIFRQFQSALIRLDSVGVRPLVVVGASNDGVDAYWSGVAQLEDSFPHQVVVVGASTRGRQRASFSNFGTRVQVMAPGDSVYALQSTGAIAPASGTSFAAPYAAGLAALLLSFDPGLTAAALDSLIVNGAIRGGRTAGGIPILNAYESLKLAAERPGAPLCGNRVFVRGDSVFVQRGSAGPDEKILTIPGAGGDGWVLTYHGGRFLQAVNPYQWTSTGWIPSDTVPQDFAQSLTGSALSRAWVPGNSPVSHDFDSTAFEVEISTSPRTFDLRLALLSDPSQSRLVTSFPGLWNNDAIAIPPVGPELVVGVLRDDGVYTTWDVYAVHQATGAQRFLFSRTGSVYLSPGFSEDGAELSLSRYQTDGQCVTEFLSPVTGAPLRSAVSYPAGGYPYCHGPAAWGASRRPVNSTRRH